MQPRPYPHPTNNLSTCLVCFELTYGSYGKRGVGGHCGRVTVIDKTIILLFCSILTIRAVRTVLLRFLDNVVRMDEYLLHSSSKIRKIRCENMQVPAVKAGPKTALLKELINEKRSGLKVLSFHKSRF
jgi:hypothetical protein